MPTNPLLSQHRTFRIDLCLGRGGFGEVYRARMKQPGGLTTTVALKVLLAGVAAESQPVERLRDEGRLLAQLEHPVIMRVIDIAQLDHRVALVIEYIAGQDLSECCRGPAPVSQAGLVHVIGEVASALNKAWSTPAENGEPLRLVHRDIKPSNIRIGQHGQVKLLDFGIARSDEMVREAQTATQMVVGSLHYMAPERFSDRPLGPEADIFGLGCCLFEGLSGQKLNTRLKGPRLLALALDETLFAKHLVRRRRALREGTDPRMVALMEACLSHNPDDRPTASELVVRCDALADVMPGPSLRSWARGRLWPEEGESGGPMVGRSFTDTLAMSVGSAPGESIGPVSEPGESFSNKRKPQPSSRWLTRLMAGLGLVGLGGSCALALVVGLAWLNQDVLNDVFGSPTLPPVEQIAPEMPTETPETTPNPLPIKAFPISTPVIHPEHPTDPPPREQAPVRDVPPVSPPVVGPLFGTVVIHGVENVVLRGAKGSFGAGPVPVGAYTVIVDTGGGPQRSISVQVEDGQALVLQCNGLLTSCELGNP